jgi:hypothetical protein
MKVPPQSKHQKLPPEPQLDLREGQSLELLKALHILTRDGKINQDSRRKLKQVNHLTQFMSSAINTILEQRDGALTLVDHGAGKSYLGFMLYDRYLQNKPQAQIYGIETRAELVTQSQALATRLGFHGMHFLNLAVAEAVHSPALPETIDIVTALHACNTATDDAIDFALHKRASTIVLVPCCQAEVAACLNNHKQAMLCEPVTEIWRHAHHTREFGSHMTNVLRCLRLEAHGYHVTVTELVGWEHAMKNELIIAEQKNLPRQRATHRLQKLLVQLGLEDLQQRFGLIGNTDGQH